MAITKFKVNGRTYTAREIDFNAVCEFDKAGISIAKLKDTPFAAARAYLAICGDMEEDAAGNEIQAHVMDGGNVSQILNALSSALRDSGFFRKAAETSEEEPSEEEPVEETEVEE